MDPNANLAAQATARGAELTELRAALADWILAGGFTPDWTRHPAAAHAFDRWCARQWFARGASRPAAGARA